MRNINLKTIRIDGDTQSRVRLDESAVADYTQVLKDGGDLPPVVVFFDGAENWLADGFHRYHAYSGDKRASIPADVRSGTRRDAMLFSFGANGAHGLRRTNDDKRKAVSAMLSDDIWSAWSDRDIAKACIVSHTFVAGIRAPKPGNVATSPQADPVITREVPKNEARGIDTNRNSAAEPEDFGPDAEELASDAAGEQADLEAVALILASDAPLADMAARNKVLTAQVAALTLRIAGLQNANNEHIRTIKGLRRKLEKLEQAA